MVKLECKWNAIGRNASENTEMNNGWVNLIICQLHKYPYAFSMGANKTEFNDVIIKNKNELGIQMKFNDH